MATRPPEPDAPDPDEAPGEIPPLPGEPDRPPPPDPVSR